ncbi:MAG: hypothetical protein R3B72_49475 [Polyangiaceae bacterium]
MYERGRKRFAEGDIQGALDDYREVFARKPGAHVAANRGNAAYQLGLWAEAATSLRWAVAHLPADTADYEATKTKYEARLAQARAKAGALELTVTPAAATVLVDGAELSTLTLDEVSPVFVMPGPRRVVVRHEGYASHDEVVEVGAGVVTAVRVELGAEASGGGPVSGRGPGADGTDEEALPVWPGWVGVGVGAAGLAVGGVLMGLSVAADHDATGFAEQASSYPGVVDNPCGESNGVTVPGCGELVDALERRSQLRTGSIVAFAAAGALAVGGVVWLLVAGENDADEEGGYETLSLRPPTVAWSPAGAMVLLGGAF